MSERVTVPTGAVPTPLARQASQALATSDRFPTELGKQFSRLHKRGVPVTRRVLFATALTLLAEAAIIYAALAWL